MTEVLVHAFEGNLHGVKRTVHVYQDRLEYEALLTAYHNTHAGLKEEEIPRSTSIPFRDLMRVAAKRAGLRKWSLVLTTSSGSFSFIMGHAEAENARALLLRLMPR